MESRQNAIIYWTLLAYKEWSFYIAASEKGLSYVGSQQKPFEEMSDWISRRFPESKLVQDDEKMVPFVQELIEYLQGVRQAFSIPLTIVGLHFNSRCGKRYVKSHMDKRGLIRTSPHIFKSLLQYAR